MSYEVFTISLVKHYMDKVVKLDFLTASHVAEDGRNKRWGITMHAKLMGFPKRKGKKKSSYTIRHMPVYAYSGFCAMMMWTLVYKCLERSRKSLRMAAVRTSISSRCHPSTRLKSA